MIKTIYISNNCHWIVTLLGLATYFKIAYDWNADVLSRKRR